jgi:hypothetical protein
MTYTVSIDINAPAELYDVFHAALLEHTGGHVDGLLAHIAWPTATGFRIIEVFASKDHRDRASQDIIPRVWSTLTASEPGPFDAMPDEHVEELDTRGLIIPSANLAV